MTITALTLTATTPTMIEDDIAPKLLEAFSPLNENNLPELGAVYSTMVTAVNLGVGLPTQRGIQLLSWAAHQFMANAQNGNSEEHEANRLNSILDSDVMRSVLMGRFTPTTTGSAGGTPKLSNTSAKNELLFHSMLSPTKWRSSSALKIF